MEEKNKEVKLSTQDFYTSIVNNCLNNLFDSGDRLKVTHGFVDGEKVWLDLDVVSEKGGSRPVIYSVECQLSIIMDALQDAIKRERYPKDLDISDYDIVDDDKDDDETQPIEEKNLD